MSQIQTGLHCSHCEKNVLATRQTPNHLLHFFLTLFTVGAWGIVWLILSLGMVGAWRCTQCGRDVQPQHQIKQELADKTEGLAAMPDHASDQVMGAKEHLGPTQKLVRIENAFFLMFIGGLLVGAYLTFSLGFSVGGALLVGFVLSVPPLFVMVPWHLIQKRSGSVNNTPVSVGFFIFFVLAVGIVGVTIYSSS